MNGYISKNVLAANLVTLSANIQNMPGAEIHTGVIMDTLNTFTNEMVEAANRTFLDALVMALDDTKPNQKIQLIKRVRELTGTGLKESKEAVEDLLPQALVIQIERLYSDLAVANGSVSWNQTRLPDQTLLNSPNSEERQDDKDEEYQPF